MREEEATSLYIKRRARQIIHEWDLEAQASIRENSEEEHDLERRLQEAVRSGLSDDDLDYLGRDPITEEEYLNRHHHVVGSLRKAIKMGEVNAVEKGQTLWIQNVEPKKIKRPWYGGL
ncbi:hypothetical protein [Halorhodospira halophila]|uniref:hypothetical protein n=1 Tax=Halorhodospira halophila TaxID=1053 RepID=UPI0019135E14|nr:hypothetical protein [Halorhodospira halophila]